MNNSIFYFFFGLLDQQSSVSREIIVFLADILPYVVLVILVIFYFILFKSENDFRKIIPRYWEEISVIFLSVVTAWGLTYVLKIFFHTPRPFDLLPNVVALLPETGFAFPSMHSAFFMALAVSVLYFHKKFGYFLVVLALFIGAGRIMAGVHFPVDILGGFFVGGLIAWTFHTIFSKFAYSDGNI